jgi:hypothetical protein
MTYHPAQGRYSPGKQLPRANHKRAGLVRRWRWPLAIFAAAAVVLLAWWYERQSGTVEIWENRLLTATPEELPEVLRRIAALGDRGIVVLVVSLGSSDPRIAGAAKQVLLSEVDDWEMLPAKKAAGHLSVLADALAEHMDDYDVPARRVAGDLALRILLWPLDDVAMDRTHLIAACDAILRDSTREPIAKSRLAAAGDVASGGAGRDKQLAAHLEQPRSSNAIAALSDEMQFPPLPPEKDPVQVAMSARQAEPAKLAVPAEAQPIASTAPPQDVSAASASRTISLEHETPIAVFSLLHSSDPLVTQAAMNELKRRRFSARDIDVGRHLTNPDATQRRRWAEALPGLAGIDAKPWLMWLSHDENPEVRLTVITLMATTSDPQMLKRVAQVAHADSDSRVQKQASRILAEQP